MTKVEQEKWQARYASLPSDPLPHQPPAVWLQRWSSVIPRGKVIDLAVGLGANAFYLASQGNSVFGIDISERALRAVRRTALVRGLKIELMVADLDVFPLPVDRFDAVLSFFYLNRCLFPRIKKSLKAGGIVIMETFVNDPKRQGGGQPSHRLHENELLNAFGDLEILDYMEGPSLQPPAATESQTATARICARKAG